MHHFLYRKAHGGPNIWGHFVQVQVGVGAKVMILVFHLHPKSLISITPRLISLRGWLLVASEGPKPICYEEKVVVVFHHPPKDQQAEEFDCWALHWFVHLTEEGEEEGLFSALNCGGANNEEVVGVAQANPNTMNDGTEMEENVPMEIHSFRKAAWLLDQLGSTMMMQHSSTTFFQARLMTIINHYQRIFQQWQAEQDPANPPPFFMT